MKKIITEGFDAFQRGTLGNGGQNLYVSKKGVLQRIYQYDVNRDGYFDLLFANCQNHHESTPGYVYHADGHRDELPAQGSISGEVVDLNGDGYPDIVIAGQYDMAAPYATTDIYYGSADGYSENLHIRIPTPWAVDVTAGDFFGDGRPSLAFVLGRQKMVRIFRQSDLGFLWDDYTDLPIGCDLIASADLDGDGFDDLIVRYQKETKTVIYWGSAEGFDVERKTIFFELPAADVLQVEESKEITSEMEKKSPTPRLLQTVVWNGRKCFTIPTGKKVLFYAANPDRTLERVLEIDVFMAMAVAVGDIDGDGYDDIAVAAQVKSETNPGGQNSFIIWNGPNGLDSRPRTVIETQQACHADIDNGSVLFCQCNVGRMYTNQSLLFTYPNFTDAVEFESEDARRGFFVKSPTGERYVFIQNHFARSSIGYDDCFLYWGSKDGYDENNMLKLPGHCAVDSLIADLDDDGWAEVLIGNNAENSVHLDVGHHLHFFGPNGFEPERSRTLETKMGWGVVAGDFDKDGYLEIVTVADKWMGLRIYSARDNFETFTQISLEEFGQGRWLMAADVNNDGWLDLIVPIISSNKSMILWGGPEGFSTDRRQDLAVWKGVSCAAADLTGNGYPDVIIGGHTETPKADGYLTTGMPHHSYVNIYWNGPEGISDARKSVLRADAGCSFAVADFNGDGWLDVFVGSYHGGKDRDTNSFLYWNREGKFRELDRQLLYTHSASGCVAADFNEDGYIDLAVANHKVDGDHKGYSTVWWNGEKGFNPERCTNLPTNGPHGMTAINPGNILNRSDSEFYYSESFPVDADCTVKSASVEADIPEKTAVLLTVSVNGGEWTKPEGTALKKGDSFQYRLEIVAKNCLRTPRITKVCVDFAE